MVVEAMLQSPHFLFRVERGRADPTRNTKSPAGSRTSSGTRCPSDELLRAAGEGRTGDGGADRSHGAADARRSARQSCDGGVPGAVAAVRPRAGGHARSPAVPRIQRRSRRGDGRGDAAALQSPGLGRSELHGVLHRQLHVRQHATSPGSTACRRPARNSPRSSIRPIPAAPACWGTAASWCSTSKPAETSPTARGLFVRNHFLGQEVPPPPPGVNTVLPNVTEDTPLTNRQRLDVHLNSEACSGCHRLIDPDRPGLRAIQRDRRVSAEDGAAIRGSRVMKRAAAGRR